jgi:hypothetical protein
MIGRKYKKWWTVGQRGRKCEEWEGMWQEGGRLFSLSKHKRRAAGGSSVGRE